MAIAPNYQLLQQSQFLFNLFIPIGLNIAGPESDSGLTPEQRMAQLEGWMKSLAKNRGNFIRIWLGYEVGSDYRDGTERGEVDRG